MKQIVLVAMLVSAMALGGCATAAKMFSKIEGSKEFDKFCKWSSVAVAAVSAAALESSKDPAKAKVTQSLFNTVGLLQVASAQCPAP